MTEQELIASGKLELYVCGSLPENEVQEVEDAIAQYPNLKKEIEIIESSLIQLAEGVAPPLSAMVWTYILNSIKNVRNITKETSDTTNWKAISGWAAAILLLCGLFYFLNENNALQEELEITTTETNNVKEQLEDVTEQKIKTETILADIRSEAFTPISLPGNQNVAPEAKAKIFYSKDQQVAYIDTKELPTPPRGKVYQVWSLIMEPLTPTSMGLLDEASLVDTGLYKLENFPEAEGFGITLEPEGGSETPTLSQLYVLGTVNTAP